jgi:ankyrin repeat protein
MSEAVPLPPRPNLEQYKKLARDFQSACESSDPGAVRAWAGKLAGMQDLEITQVHREAQRIERRWHKIKNVPWTLIDSQLFLAQEHGFATWPKFSEHIEALSRDNSQVSNFEAAADAIIRGDTAALKNLLDDDPALVRTRSTREHRSTLLHYVSANGIEDFRQKTPKNIVEIANLLLARGADANAESDAYGGGSTTLGLVATSVHPERAGVQIALLETLLGHGAKIDQPAAAGNGHSVIKGCLANGQPKAAEFFANLGVKLDLESAAALGRLDLVQSHFDEKGVLRLPATNQQMESGFLYACGYGRAQVVEFLLERGVDSVLRNADGQTGLHWAAYGAHVEAVKLLLQRVPIDLKDNNFHATPLDVALYTWDSSSDTPKRERCYEVILLLARAGSKLDPEQWRDPNDDRQGMLEKIRSDSRMRAALRGESATN